MTGRVIPMDLPNPVETQRLLPPGIPEADRDVFDQEVRRLQIMEAARLQVRQDRIERESSALDALELIGVDELVVTESEGEEWLVRGLLHHAGSMMVAAAYKAGKSTLALNMVHALTTGEPFLNEFVVPEPLRVAYFDLELGKRLAKAWFVDIAPDTSRVMYCDLKGMGRRLDVRSEARFEQLVDLLRANRIDVVVIDPLSALCAALGINENSNEEVRPLLDSLDAVVAEAGCKGLIAIHHAGKDLSKGARGASAFQDWSSVNVTLTKHDGSTPSTFSAKGRDVDIRPVDLDYNDQTRRLSVGTRESTADEIFFIGKRGQPLTAAEVMGSLGVSKPTAISRLKTAAGWEITEPGHGQRGDVWEYVGGEIADPFASA